MMDLEPLVRRACEGDVGAFMELTRRIQHFAFGSALALVGDFQEAENVVQMRSLWPGRRCRPWPIRRRFRGGLGASCGIRGSACSGASDPAA